MAKPPDADTIYYLAHPYASNPTKSFEQAVSWTVQLRKMGKFVFSPICHTHPLDKMVESEMAHLPDVELLIAQMDFQKMIDYYHWDIALLEALRPNVIILMDMAAMDWQEVRHYAQDGSGNVAYSQMISKFHSHGCELEYDWAHDNYVKVYNLQAFLEGRIDVI